MKWNRVPLGDLCAIKSGGTPSRSKPHYFGGRIPWVKITDLLQGEVLQTEECLSDAGIENSAARVLPKGTVLISIFATIGRTAVLGIDAATNQAVAGITPNDPERLRPRYLRYFLDASRPRLERLARGVAQPNINQAVLKALEVPVPPSVEQDRIVNLLSRAENIVRMRREAEQKAKEIIPALFLDMFGDPATNPKGWGIQRLGDIAEVVSGVAKGRRLNGKATREVAYLRVANVQAGHLNLAEMKTIPATPSEIAELALRSGDVLLTEGGDYDKLGRGALLDHDIGECIHQNHIFRVRADPAALVPEYFVSFLQTEMAKSYFLKSAKKTTNLASINMTQLRALPVAAPTIVEQTEFALKFNACRQLEADQAGAGATSSAAFQSLLAGVFSEVRAT